MKDTIRRRTSQMNYLNRHISVRILMSPITNLPLIPLFLLGFVPVTITAQQERPAESTSLKTVARMLSNAASASAHENTDPRLIKAFSLVAVYQVERPVALCDTVLNESSDPAVLARAHWIKAVAYRNHDLEYRTDQFAPQYATELAAIRQLAPDLYLDVLARLDVAIAFHMPPHSDPATVLERFRNEYESSAGSFDALHAWVLGQAYWNAADQMDEADKKTVEAHRKHATGLLETACNFRPRSFEFRAYWMTYLAQTAQVDKAVAVGKTIAETFTSPDPFEFDRDPYCLYAAAANLATPGSGLAILEQRAQSPDAGAWVHQELTMARVNQAESDAEKARLLGAFVRRAENGEFSTRGHNRRALASAYYKLAHQLNVLDLPEQALDTYNKLEEIAPHYVLVHYNKGVILGILAEKETDHANTKALLEQAREQFTIQQRYPWHGATPGLQQALEQVERKLQALEQSPAQPQ